MSWEAVYREGKLTTVCNLFLSMIHESHHHGSGSHMLHESHHHGSGSHMIHESHHHRNGSHHHDVIHSQGRRHIFHNGVASFENRREAPKLFFSATPSFLLATPTSSGQQQIWHGQKLNVEPSNVYFMYI